MKRKDTTDYIVLAHEQLDEWIAGKVYSPYYFRIGNDVLDLGKLKLTMEKAKLQWEATHLKPETVSIHGKEYNVHDIEQLLKGKEL